MNFRIDLKKLAKSYSARKRSVAKKITKYIKKQRLTQGDIVFLTTMSLVFILILTISGKFGLLIVESNKPIKEGGRYGIQNNRKPKSDLKAISLGIRSTEAKNGSDGKDNISISQKLPILMYHRIDVSLIPGDRFSAGLTVSPQKFEEQLAYLSTQGYTTLSLGDLYRAFYAGKKLPPKSVVLTFDDGTAGNYTYAYPLLKKYNLKATFFVPPAYLDVNPNYMTKAQVKEMSEGGMDIESHTTSHLNLASADLKVVEAELTESRRLLKEITGTDILFLAYPYGGYNPAVIEAARKAGYLMAVTTRNGNIQKSEAPFELLRYYVSPNNSIGYFASLID